MHSVIKNCVRQMSCISQRGFSLIELSVVLMVIGFLIGAAITLVRPYVDTYRYESTKKKMEVIADAISMYAQQNYFIPCPSDATPGPDLGLPVAPITLPWSGLYGRTGIVPFRVLGLDESMVKDAYGNYITYRFGFFGCGSTGIALSNHRRFTSEPFVDLINSYPSGGTRYYNRAKASFCHPHWNTLTIRKMDGDVIYVREPSGAASMTTEIVSFALFSHGKNMKGAFSPATGARSSGIGPGAEGDYNANARIHVVIDRPNTNVGSSYFDDIGIYRTNHQVMSAQGGPGCMNSKD